MSLMELKASLTAVEQFPATPPASPRKISYKIYAQPAMPKTNPTHALMPPVSPANPKPSIIMVPLQMIEFNLILKAAGKPVTGGMFWRLLIGTIMMLGFVFGMAGWAYILYEIFLGEAGGVAGNCSAAVKDAFSYMRIIVTAGWSIYPLGYYYGYLLGAVDETLLNVVYNVADFVNKIAFVLACWSAAKADSEGK